MSYEDDDDDDDSQEYECQNVGCAGDRIFEAAPEEWFEDNDMDLPKNCQICRDWNADQKRIGPIAAKCRFCGYTWQIEATYRIIYHKKVGNWDAYWTENETLQICRRCMEIPFRRRMLRERVAASRLRKPYYPDGQNQVGGKKQAPHEREPRVPDERHSRRQELLKYVEEHGLGKDPKQFDVPDSMVFYQGVKTPALKAADHGDNQLTHILKKDHKWADKLGSEDPHTLLALARHIAISTEAHVLQFTDQRSHLIVKYDLNQEVAVIIREAAWSPTGFLTHTTFPKLPKAVLSKLENGYWA